MKFKGGSEYMAKVRVIESKTTKFFNFLIFIFLTCLSIVTVYPIVYIILGSFKENLELVAGGVNIFPEKFIFDNYVQAWEIADFSQYTMNSIFLGVSITTGALFISSMSGYVFSRKEFPFKKLIFNTMIAFMFINVGSASLRPMFELAVDLNLNQSLWGVVLISIGSGQATNIFLVRGYLNSVPRELDEAAKIDGCSFFETYWRIILPNLKPALGTVALLTFRGAWNEYVLPMIFTMSNQELRPLTVGVVALQNTGDGAAAWNLMFAGSTISIVPIVIVYLFARKQFINGTMSGAVKG